MNGHVRNSDEKFSNKTLPFSAFPVVGFLASTMSELEHVWRNIVQYGFITNFITDCVFSWANCTLVLDRMMKPVVRAYWKCRKDFLLLSRFDVCCSTGWWCMYGRCMWGCNGTCPWSPVEVFRSTSSRFPVGTENSGTIERNIATRLLSKMHKQTVCFPHACLVCTNLTLFWPQMSHVTWRHFSNNHRIIQRR